MLDVLIVAAAVAPALIVLRLFISWDLFPEPTGMILATFLWGMASIVPVLLVGDIIVAALQNVEDPFWSAAGFAFLAAALPEELAKFAVLTLFCMRHSHFDEPMDGLVYGMTASLGFAALENIAYLIDAGEGWVDVALLRAFLSVPSHGLDGAIMGFFAALAHFEKRRATLWWFLALAVPISLHGLYNTPLFLADFETGAADDSMRGLFVLLPLAILAVEIGWAVRLFRRVNRDQKALLARVQAAPGD